MPLIYTTTEAIARKLKGRLKVTHTLSPGMAPSVNAQQVVDPLLIEDTGAQVEDELNMILRQIYEMPLVNQHPILAGIVEKMVIAQLMPVHFQGGNIPELNGDAGFGALMYRQAKASIAMLTAGHNIVLDGIPNPPSIPGIATPQPLILDGESLRFNPPDTLTRNDTFVGQSRGRAMSDETRVEWGITWGNHRSRNSENPYD